jgi:hypothetical protein
LVTSATITLKNVSTKDLSNVVVVAYHVKRPFALVVETQRK